MSTNTVTVPERWSPIATAPRDGSTILLRFGIDGTSQGRYVYSHDRPQHPWEFIDDQGSAWIVNHAVDAPGGPSHWAPFAAPTPTVAADAVAPSDARFTHPGCEVCAWPPGVCQSEAAQPDERSALLEKWQEEHFDGHFRQLWYDAGITKIGTEQFIKQVRAIIERREKTISVMQERAARAASKATVKGDEQMRVKIARALHYPACWDTAAYPTLESAAWEAIACAKLGCSACEPDSSAAPQASAPLTYERFCEIASPHMESADSNMYVSFLPSQFREFADSLIAALPTERCAANTSAAAA
jgi:hypothetical protein